jgi:hypothetical protein
MKLVLLSSVPSVGPSFAPTASSNRQAIEPEFGQLGSPELAGIAFPLRTAAHTLLLSNELCHVALPKGTGRVGSLGFSFGLEEVSDDLEVLPAGTLKKRSFGPSGVDRL